jgi:hypothetical protein
MDHDRRASGPVVGDVATPSTLHLLSEAAWLGRSVALAGPASAGRTLLLEHVARGLRDGAHVLAFRGTGGTFEPQSTSTALLGRDAGLSGGALGDSLLQGLRMGADALVVDGGEGAELHLDMAADCLQVLLATTSTHVPAAASVRVLLDEREVVAVDLRRQ